MDYSTTFARHFSRLVSLLMHEVGNTDEQKVSLRALVTVNKNGPVTLVEQEWNLVVNDQTIPGALTGVQDVAAQMAANSVVKIAIAANTGAADLLGLARILASEAKPGDGGAHAREKLAALNPKGIEFTTSAPVPPAPAPVSQDAPTVVAPLDEKETAKAQSAKLVKDMSALVGRAATTDYGKVTAEELLATLAKADDIVDITRALDELVSLADHSARIGKAVVVGDVLHGVVSRDATLPDGDIKRAHVMAIRRMSKPALLRAVTSLIPKKPERRQRYFEVLARTGEEGADALIQQITQAQTAEDRKTLFEVLGELPDAVPALVRMLGDSRWFVVRNAADLLGEMVATKAEDALVGLLRHADDRVRRSATNALLKLGTPNAVKGIYDAVSDSSPEVRMQAAAAMATRKDGRSSQALIRAIEDEADADVQLAMIAALGRVATPEAVQKLVKMAEPEGRLFRKKSTNIRVAAVQALGDAKTAAAVAALRELSGDKENDVRETARRALAHAGR
jgi:HEAT repeat protein